MRYLTAELYYSIGMRQIASINLIILPTVSALPFFLVGSDLGRICPGFFVGVKIYRFLHGIIAVSGSRTSAYDMYFTVFHINCIAISRRSTVGNRFSNGCRVGFRRYSNGR